MTRPCKGYVRKIRVNSGNRWSISSRLVSSVLRVISSSNFLACFARTWCSTPQLIEIKLTLQFPMFSTHRGTVDKSRKSSNAYLSCIFWQQFLRYNEFWVAKVWHNNVEVFKQMIFKQFMCSMSHTNTRNSIKRTVRDIYSANDIREADALPHIVSNMKHFEKSSR